MSPISPTSPKPLNPDFREAPAALSLCVCVRVFCICSGLFASSFLRRRDLGFGCFEGVAFFWQRVILDGLSRARRLLLWRVQGCGG